LHRAVLSRLDLPGGTGRRQHGWTTGMRSNGDHGDVRAELDRSAELREQAARSQAQAAQLARQAARRPRDQGVPLQDVGKALGVSFQRAKQLIDEADKLAS